MSKYGVFSVSYFPVFGPEKTPYLDFFHAVNIIALPSTLNFKEFKAWNWILLTTVKIVKCDTLEKGYEHRICSWFNKLEHLFRNT